jgi:hypothetical protein
MALGIFISYRRADVSATCARRIHDELSARVQSSDVFVDDADLRLGPFPQQIADAIERTHIFIAVIGKA